MTHKERLRDRIRVLLQLGVSQKVIAGRLGLSESTFSRWYRDQPDSKGRPVKVPLEALDAFERYLQEFAVLTQDAQETQRSEAAAATLQATGTAGGSFRSGGSIQAGGYAGTDRRHEPGRPPPGVPERRGKTTGGID